MLISIFAFIAAIAGHWLTLVAGGAPPVAIDAALRLASHRYKTWADSNAPLRRRIEVGFLLLAVVAASFQVFEEERGDAMTYARAFSSEKNAYGVTNALALERSRELNEIPRPEAGPLRARAVTPSSAPFAPAPQPPASRADPGTAARFVALTAEGAQINKAFWDTNDAGTMKTASTAWGNRVIEFLTPINPVYSLRFAAAHAAETVVSNPTHDVAGCNQYNMNLAKIDVLVQIAKEIDHE